MSASGIIYFQLLMRITNVGKLKSWTKVIVMLVYRGQ